MKSLADKIQEYVAMASYGRTHAEWQALLADAQALEDENDRRAATINGLTVALQSMKAERDAMHDTYVRGLRDRESLEESLTLVRRGYARVIEERDAARLQALRECLLLCGPTVRTRWQRGGQFIGDDIQALIDAEESKDGDT